MVTVFILITLAIILIFDVNVPKVARITLLVLDILFLLLYVFGVSVHGIAIR